MLLSKWLSKQITAVLTSCPWWKLFASCSPETHHKDLRLFGLVAKVSFLLFRCKSWCVILYPCYSGHAYNGASSIHIYLCTFLAGLSTNISQRNFRVLEQITLHAFATYTTVIFASLSINRAPLSKSAWCAHINQSIWSCVEKRCETENDDSDRPSKYNEQRRRHEAQNDENVDPNKNISKLLA